MNTLAMAVRELALNRQQLDEAKAELTRRKVEFEEANAELIQQCQALTEQVAEGEARVRSEALAQWDGKNKRPVPGVSIRIKKQLEYDKTEALEWVMEKGLRQLIRLDTRAFEKAAPSLQPECVKINEVPQATIARDLSEWLSE